MYTYILMDEFGEAEVVYSNEHWSWDCWPKVIRVSVNIDGELLYEHKTPDNEWNPLVAKK